VPLDKMLPNIPGTRIHIGLLVAFAAILVVHYLLTRTSWGLRLQIMGANPRAARHFGINLPRLIVVAFLASGFLVGLAACADIMGLWGYIRTGWDPAYGDTIIPFVFLARLNALAVVPFVAFFSVLSTGGDLAAQQANLPTDFLYVLVGLILLFMTVIEYLGRRRELGQSYVPDGLRQADPLPEPLFTPTTKAEAGHDLPLTTDEAVALVGGDAYERLKEYSLRLYERGAEHARSSGLILADTKFEFGERDGEILVIDEMMTPDSSRYWPQDEYRAGTSPPSFDKQYVRDFMDSTGWNHEPPAPHMPAAVIANTRGKYVEAYELVTGEPFADWYGPDDG